MSCDREISWDVPSGCPSYSTDSLRSLSSLWVGSSPTSPASSCWMLLLRYCYGGYGDPQSGHLAVHKTSERSKWVLQSFTNHIGAKEWLSQLPFATPRPTVYHGSSQRDISGSQRFKSSSFTKVCPFTFTKTWLLQIFTSTSWNSKT